MTFKPKKEEVSISFHYLVKERKADDDNPVSIPFNQQEFEEVYKKLDKTRQLNINDEEISERIRYRALAVIDSVEAFDIRFITGIYKASYWGHSYDNSVKGKIPADSINLRPFFFLLYLSESGKIYIASQYLGNYGGYTAIKNTIIPLFSNHHDGISSKSFNLGGISIENAIAKEVEVTFSRQGKSISSGNLFGKSAAITFKKQSRDDGFEGDVTRELLSHAKKQPSEIKKIIAKLLKSNELMEINDDEIENCKVIALLNGKRKVINLLDESNFASRFSLSVPLNDDGHPLYEPLKQKVIELLKKEIISKKENV